MMGRMADKGVLSEAWPRQKRVICAEVQEYPAISDRKWDSGQRQVFAAYGPQLAAAKPQVPRIETAGSRDYRQIRYNTKSSLKPPLHTADSRQCRDQCVEHFVGMADCQAQSQE